VCELAEKTGAFHPVAAGATIPGLADSAKGIWCYAPFSGISEIPIVRILEEKLGLPVYIENDVNACAVGEKMFGNCREDSDFLWMTVSNGIGGAFFLNGKLYTGSCSNAGEIGHLTVEEHDGALCGCGKRGCLEAMASGKGIERAYAEKTGESKTAQEIAELAKSGSEAAKEVFRAAGQYIGKAISLSVNLLNIQKVIVGGGVSQSFDLWKASMEQAVVNFLFQKANPCLQIEQTGLGYDAALIGAAAVAMENIKKEK